MLLYFEDKGYRENILDFNGFEDAVKQPFLHICPTLVTWKLGQKHFSNSPLNVFY